LALPRRRDFGVVKRVTPQAVRRHADASGDVVESAQPFDNHQINSHERMGCGVRTRWQAMATHFLHSLLITQHCFGGEMASFAHSHFFTCQAVQNSQWFAQLNKAVTMPYCKTQRPAPQSTVAEVDFHERRRCTSDETEDRNTRRTPRRVGVRETDGVCLSAVDCTPEARTEDAVTLAEISHIVHTLAEALEIYRFNTAEAHHEAALLLEGFSRDWANIRRVRRDLLTLNGVRHE